MGKLIIWIAPRSRSTAICRALTNNTETVCLFHPYTYGRRNDDGEIPVHEKVKNFFKNSDYIFMKDNAVYFSEEEIDFWTHQKSVSHVLMIRNPEQIALSTVKVDGKPTPYFIRSQIIKANPLNHYLEALIKIRDSLKNIGRPYLIFDTSSMNAERSEKIVKSVCDFAKLPFDQKMMEMVSCEGADLPMNWWIPYESKDSIQIVNGFKVDMYENALKSTNLGVDFENSKFTRKKLSSNELKQLDHLIARCMPLYENLQSDCKCCID